MKHLPLLAASIFTAALASAQDAPKPALRSEPQLRPTAPAPAAGERQDPIGLIPDLLEPAPKPEGGAIPQPGRDLSGSDGRGPRVDRTTAAQDEMAARIRFRELTNKVSLDPKIAGELEKANNAKTDLEKREGLKQYYTLLYGRVVKLDRSLEKRATALKARLIHRLAQTRIDPTEPIDPGEREERLAQE
jgi:hypothetical protein